MGDFGRVVKDEHIHDACIVNARAGAPFERADASVASVKNIFSTQRQRLDTDSDKRKEYPIHSGVIRYFPDALAEVARLSLEATNKHHPGQPMHWERSKSGDELDALCRHLAEAGTLDTDGFFHDVKVAWRSLANLQKLLERERNLPISPASKP